MRYRLRYRRSRATAQALGVVLGLLLAACGGDGPTQSNGSVAALAFVRQPGDGVAGAALGEQPVVELRDASGHRVVGATGSITLALTGGGTLIGTRNIDAVDGVATFTDIGVAGAVTGATLTATMAGVAAATSDPFDVSADAAYHLSFVTQPADAAGGTQFGAQPRVEVRDADGKPVAASVTVTVSLSGGVAGAKLAGRASVATVDGVAAFTDLAVDAAGTGYLLRAAAPGAVAATSEPFAVSVGPASPARSAVSALFGTMGMADTQSVTLRVTDAGGNAVVGAGPTVAFSLAGSGGGTLGPVTTLGDGRYRSVLTAQHVGSVSVQATIDGAPLTSTPVTVAIVGFEAVDAGAHHSCGIVTGGAAWCWGMGLGGMLGQGQNTSPTVPLPVPVSGDKTWSGIAASGGHSCGIATDGTAWCWGDHGNGALGTGVPPAGSLTNTNVPVAVVGGHRFEVVRTHVGNTNCALTASGAAWCWGAGNGGQLGNGTTTLDNPSPVAAANGLVLGSVGLGALHGCGITTAGAAYCWGFGGFGQLGAGPGAATERCDGGVACSTVPVPVSGGLVFDPHSLAVGGDFACALTTSGEAYCWGNDSSGQLGLGAPTGIQWTPAPVSGGLRFASLAAGSIHTCGIATSGITYCWGLNSAGQLGDGTSVSRSAPVAVAGSLGFVSLSLGDAHSCGVTAAGAAYCWGSNDYGQLGEGGTTARSVPMPVLLLH